MKNLWQNRGAPVLQAIGATIAIRARLGHLRWRFLVVGAKEGEAIVSEATGGDRAQMKRRLIERSLQDDAFRQRLLENPKGAIEQELGTPVPEEVQILAVEETQDTIYLVLPPPPRRSTGARSPTSIWRRWPAVN